MRFLVSSHLTAGLPVLPHMDGLDVACTFHFSVDKLYGGMTIKPTQHFYTVRGSSAKNSFRTLTSSSSALRVPQRLIFTVIQHHCYLVLQLHHVFSRIAVYVPYAGSYWSRTVKIVDNKLRQQLIKQSNFIIRTKVVFSAM